ncbi:metal-sensing transcriptional repressor [Falsirhodobacter sp. 20TX0035]|uniref:metal-sensing transcriptional repressor n=1 Tax=Falsirhodobacter sp. 20TX0035 TaxID=3022019 RepID=UPI00232AEC1A|nr:metal-sensing transcriptional repressor [Falsirhodobacter sp. 20TX0035]MDB6454069.1 metal-sensing transcriptional repressor [Falsirhodobacter sp. 20TX0035]
MSHAHHPSSHPDIIKRLKRAAGHLQHVIAMLEQDRPCLDTATQLLAVERGIIAAKRTLIHNHMDHCLGTAEDGAGPHDLEEIKALAKLL